MKKKTTKIENIVEEAVQAPEVEQTFINLTEEESRAYGQLYNEMNHYQMLIGKHVLEVLRTAQFFGQRDSKLTELVNDKISLSGLENIRFKQLDLQGGKIILDKVERKGE